ncbi:glycosyltransferase family 8 protein [Alkalibacterium kapii]|uniref:Glycosyl transferase family 8 n=1 Tax=Alkalibacterium kapii TaxID=426704 RepID=A0A511AQI2_9LACT|nr:glycosyltransferase family 8 protein [Alkalibacterium kapii]GEK90460.1 glycosyl transferase family 8 [Alkalibacterium kapii]
MINLLFSLDENYVYPLRVLIHSIIENHPDESFRMYLLHAGISKETLKELETFVEKNGDHELVVIYCKDFFKPSDKLAITRYYSLEMYLWMFAPYILPADIDRILYLDPDIINVGDIRTFYNKTFDGHSFIATNYKYKTKWIQPFNNIRLGNFESENYFNSGVVLMNLEKLRRVGNPDQIVEAIRENKSILILPDQDIFNMLYVNDIKEEDWRIYNMNPKVYEKLKVIFPNKYNFQMIEDKVVFIHYLGKHKPWDKREKYKYELGKYYFEAERKTYDFIDVEPITNKGNK